MTANKTGKSILVVDDEDAIRDAMCESLIKEGYEVVGSPNAANAVYNISQMKVDVAILDILMPEMSGFDLMQMMKKICPETIIIIHSGIIDPESRFANVSEAGGVFAFLKKPCSLKVLKETVRKAFEE